MVHQFGWDCQLTLDKEVQAELAWLHSNLARFNGQGIRNERGREAVYTAPEVGLQETEETEEELMQAVAGTQGEFSFTFKLNQEMELTEELPERTAEGWQQATQELDTLTGLVQQQGPATEHASWQRWFWLTGSRSCHVWLRKGSRHAPIKERLLRLKRTEQSRKITVVPI
jgi:hypothetical protein